MPLKDIIEAPSTSAIAHPRRHLKPLVKATVPALALLAGAAAGGARAMSSASTVSRRSGTRAVVVHTTAPSSHAVRPYGDSLRDAASNHSLQMAESEVRETAAVRHFSAFRTKFTTKGQHKPNSERLGSALEARQDAHDEKPISDALAQYDEHNVLEFLGDQGWLAPAKALPAVTSGDATGSVGRRIFAQNGPGTIATGNIYSCVAGAGLNSFFWTGAFCYWGSNATVNLGACQEQFNKCVGAPKFVNATPYADGDITDTTFPLAVAFDKPATVYYVVLPAGSAAPTSVQVRDGQNNAGGAALVSGSFSLSAAYSTVTTNISGLSASTSYVLYGTPQGDPPTVSLALATFETLASGPKSFNFLTSAPANDSDGDLVASNNVSEPVALPTSIDTAGEALNVFDFTLSDGGTSDGLSLGVSRIDIDVSGTSTDATRAKVTWRLDGTNVNQKTGTYSAATDTLSFSNLSISVPNGQSQTFWVNAYYNDNANLTDGHTFVLSVDGDTDLTVSSTGTQMGTTTAVTNGTGTAVDVAATNLVFSTQPAGSVSGAALTTQPIVTAQDAVGNTDTDFTETVTLSESSAGSLSGDVDVAAVAGVATFTDVIYTASADQESFTLTANDDDGVGAQTIPTVGANAVTADVVATKLVFDTEPAPLSVRSGVAKTLTAAPVVSARDAADTLDTDYVTNVKLTEVAGAGSAVMTSTGDTDSDNASVTVTPVAGVATFAGMALTYTQSGADAETFKLQASSGSFTTDSAQFSTESDTDGDGIYDGDDPFPNAVTSLDASGISVATIPQAAASTCSLDSDSFQPQATVTAPSGDVATSGSSTGVSFRLTGCATGESLPVSIDLGAAPGAGFKAFKVNGDDWTLIEGATLTGSVIAYTLTDNGPLDLDAADGVIEDPVAVALPVVVPASPTDLEAIAGDQQIALSWTAPDDGGSAITDYEYSSDAGTSWTSLSTTGTSATIAGLTNGTAYTLIIRAVNAVGGGAPSAGVTATPAASPAVPPTPVPIWPLGVLLGALAGIITLVWRARDRVAARRSRQRSRSMD